MAGSCRAAMPPRSLLHPSDPPATLSNTCSTDPRSRRPHGHRQGPDKAPAGDLRLHQEVLRPLRLPADGARHRQGGRPRLVLDGARAPGQPGEGRPAAARPVEAARDRAARQGGRRRQERPARQSGLPLVGRVAAGQPILAEENIEDYVHVSALAGGDEGEFVLAVRGDSMVDAGILDGDFVVVRPQETARTARSSSPWSARRRRSSASSRRPTTCACSRRTRRWNRSARAT